MRHHTGIGKLAWRTPAGAMLWEVWGRRKWNFAMHGAALLAGVTCVWWIRHGGSNIASAVLRMVLTGLFLGSFLDIATCFGYVEIDAGKVRAGFPGGLLMRPVSTLKLALIPMFFGGMALLALLLFWYGLVLRLVVPSSSVEAAWVGAVTLSFFWWIQALAWGLPAFPGRSIILVLAGVVHLLEGLMPLMPGGISSGWFWLIPAGMMGAAVFGALIGLRWMRCGTWEGLSGFFEFLRRLRPSIARSVRPKFDSAFQAQLWFEWRNQGILLPGLSFSITFVVLPIVFVIQSQLDQGRSSDGFVLIFTGFGLFVPLAISGAVGPAMARFEPLQSLGEPPIYISIRPMTNGGFVLAKLVSALLSSIATWLVVPAVIFLWLLVFERGSLGSKLAGLSPQGPMALLMGSLPWWVLLVVFTWKNLVRGLGVGLTGRRWIGLTFNLLSGVVGAVFFGLLTAAYFNEDLKRTLLRWLPAMVVAVLAVKLVVSAFVFIRGLRSHVLKPAAVGWIAGGWILCGMVMAGFALLACVGAQQPGYRIWAVPAGFLLVPLVDLAAAPLALAWNRHR